MPSFPKAGTPQFARQVTLEPSFQVNRDVGHGIRDGQISRGAKELPEEPEMKID
jgi:hypothetical protein